VKPSWTQIGCAVVVLAFFLAGFAQTNEKPSPGESIYKAKCALCHGSDGTGKTTLGEQMKAADFHSREILKLTDAQLAEVVTHGKDNMPPFDGQLSADETSQVVSYVRLLGKKKASPKTRAGHD
jgi:mono/diheme cytochrome c family protein